LAILFFYSNTINPNGLITYYDLLYGYSDKYDRIIYYMDNIKKGLT